MFGLVGAGGLASTAAAAAAVVIVASLVAPVAPAAPTPQLPAGVAQQAGVRIAVGDYRDGATVTWTADVASTGPVLDYWGQSFAFPGAWVADWPTEEAGNGDIVGDRLVGIDPADGAVLWTDEGRERQCAADATAGWLLCREDEGQLVQVFDPATGRDPDAPLADRRANWVGEYEGSVLLAFEQLDDSGHDALSFGRYAITGAAIWEVEASCEFGAAPGAGAGVAASIWTYGELRLLGSCYSALVDPETGTVLASGDAEAYAPGGIGGPEGVDRGELWLSTEGDELVANDSAADYAELWRLELPWWASPAAMGSGVSDPILLRGPDGRIARVDPVAPGPRVDGMPAELPDCPEGWTPIAWSQWDGGATLICQQIEGAQLAGYRVDPDGTSSSQRVEVRPTGFLVEFDDATVELAYDGWVVYDGDVARSAERLWSPTYGLRQGPAVVPASLPGCPAGTFPLSLSVWNGGWLLTCGVTAASPTAFRWGDEGGWAEGGALTAADGQWCGEDGDKLRVCVSTAPALVQLGAEQHSVDANFVPGVGQGGAGKGTGAYGVDAPGDTAEQQVGYLVAILQSSAAARATVGAALAPLNACSVSSGDVTALQGLTHARTELLAALQTTPVDQVPDGARLLELLKSALSLSEQADQGYVDTASQMLGGDCAGGRAAYHVALAVADQAEAAKQAFVDAWNASIPGRYGVQAFSAGDI